MRIYIPICWAFSDVRGPFALLVQVSTVPYILSHRYLNFTACTISLVFYKNSARLLDQEFLTGSHPKAYLMDSRLDNSALGAQYLLKMLMLLPHVSI